MRHKISFYRSPSRIEKVKIDDIRYNRERQVSERSVERVLREPPIAPLILKEIEGVLYLVDGFNRLMAMKRLNIVLAEALIVDALMKPHDVVVIDADPDKGTLIDGHSVAYTMNKWLELHPGGRVTVEAA